MNSGAAVIVNKGGFFSALVRGVFGTVITLLICVTALGLFGLHLADKHVSAVTREILETLPEWQRAFPPVIADALNDRRAPEYRDSLEITTKFVADVRDDERGLIVLEIQNKGPETVSLLGVRMVVEDDSQRHVSEHNTAAATPFVLADNPGPLLPGATRAIVQRLWDVAGVPKTRVEVTELRVWNRPEHGAEAPPLPFAEPQAAEPRDATPA